MGNSPLTMLLNPLNVTNFDTLITSVIEGSLKNVKSHVIHDLVLIQKKFQI